jgi:hypothetical protein
MFINLKNLTRLLVVANDVDDDDDDNDLIGS